MMSDVTSHHPGLADGPIYLDYNATTPVDPRVAEAALPYLTTHFGNPSSGHADAEQPRRALAEARQQLADLIGAQPAEMVFTAGGSEADNLAIRGAVNRLNDWIIGRQDPGKWLIPGGEKYSGNRTPQQIRPSNPHSAARTGARPDQERSPLPHSG
jgi:hypothetical protein